MTLRIPTHCPGLAGVVLELSVKDIETRAKVRDRASSRTDAPVDVQSLHETVKAIGRHKEILRRT